MILRRCKTVEWLKDSNVLLRPIGTQLICLTSVYADSFKLVNCASRLAHSSEFWPEGGWRCDNVKCAHTFRLRHRLIQPTSISAHFTSLHIVEQSKHSGVIETQQLSLHLHYQNLLSCMHFFPAAATVTNGGAEDTRDFPTSLLSDFFSTNINEPALLS